MEKVAASLTIFLLPTQLALHFWPSYAFVFGIRVDYLSPALYFSDLLILSLLFLLVVNNKKVFFEFLRKKKVFILVFLVFALMNIYFSTFPPISFYKWLKIFEAAFFAVYIYLRKEVLGEGTIQKMLFLSAFAFSLIGIAQFLLGRTTGLFYLLGERSFNLSTPGIALTQIHGMDFLRSYSTFPHPNALAGYLGIVLIVIFSSKIFETKKIFYLGLLTIALSFLLTFSQSAFLAMAALILAAFFKVIYKAKIWWVTVFLGGIVSASLIMPVAFAFILKNVSFSANIIQRLDLSVLAVGLVAERFWIGEGLNTFILNSTKFAGINVSSWLLQPVHNIFLLMFAETGIFGIILVFVLFYKAAVFAFRKKLYPFVACLFFVLFTGLTDHYWLTLQQNLLTLSLITGLSLRLKE